MTNQERDNLREVAAILACNTMSSAAKRCIRIVGKLLTLEAQGRYVAVIDPKRKKMQRVLMV